MWSCPGNMPKYYPGLGDILPDRKGGQYVSQTWVIFWYITWTRLHYYINICIVLSSVEDIVTYAENIIALLQTLYWFE